MGETADAMKEQVQEFVTKRPARPKLWPPKVWRKQRPKGSPLRPQERRSAASEKVAGVVDKASRGVSRKLDPTRPKGGTGSAKRAINPDSRTSQNPSPSIGSGWLCSANAALAQTPRIRHGPFHQRHQIDGRPVPACDAGHLLRRKADPEGAARHDREGDQPGAHRRLQKSSWRKPKSRSAASSRRSN